MGASNISLIILTVLALTKELVLRIDDESLVKLKLEFDVSFKRQKEVFRPLRHILGFYMVLCLCYQLFKSVPRSKSHERIWNLLSPLQQTLDSVFAVIAICTLSGYFSEKSLELLSAIQWLMYFQMLACLFGSDSIVESASRMLLFVACIFITVMKFGAWDSTLLFKVNRLAESLTTFALLQVTAWVFDMKDFGVLSA